MSIFADIGQKDHEQVIFCSDKRSRLRAIIAIHNTSLGPALGGARMWTYDTDEDALRDALRLSRRSVRDYLTISRRCHHIGQS